MGANGFQHGSVTTGAAFLGEAMGTYLLCYVVLESAVNSRAVTTIGGGTPGNLNLAPIAIGLVSSKGAVLEQESLPFLWVLLLLRHLLKPPRLERCAPTNQEGQHFAVHLFAHTKHSRKAGTFAVARLQMDLPFQNRLAYKEKCQPS